MCISRKYFTYIRPIYAYIPSWQDERAWLVLLYKIGMLWISVISIISDLLPVHVNDVSCPAVSSLLPLFGVMLGSSCSWCSKIYITYAIKIMFINARFESRKVCSEYLFSWTIRTMKYSVTLEKTQTHENSKPCTAEFLNFFSAVSDLDRLPFAVSPSREISISPQNNKH